MDDYIVAIMVDSADRNHEERVRLNTLRDESNPFTIAEEKFKKLFRLDKSQVQHLINKLNDPRLEEGSIPKHIKILTALQFFAQGSYQAAVGQDNLLGLSQPSVSRCVTYTAEAIISILTEEEIKFPITDRERTSTKNCFQEQYDFQNTLGVVDGTHVAIIKPNLNHPTAPGNIFYNRKGFYSINCQIVCDAKGKIVNVNPNFPGSTHDAAIWRSSNVNIFLKNCYQRGESNQWLLGDKGYPLQPWLMTPIMEPSNDAEVAYNACHARARNIIEMCIGRLKNKFRCLHKHRCLHYSPEKAAKIIVACCTLYNLFIDDISDYENEEDLDIPISNDSNNDENDFLTEARLIRQNLVNTFN